MKWVLEPRSSFHSPMHCGVSFHSALPIWAINSKSQSFQEQGQCIQTGTTPCQPPGRTHTLPWMGTWAFFTWWMHVRIVPMKGAQVPYWSPEETTAAQRALALTPGLPTLAELWAPPGPKPAQRAGNVTTLMARQRTCIDWAGELIPSRRESCLTLLNISKGVLVAHNLALQSTEESCTVGAFYGRLELGLASGNSCSSILPALRMLHTAIPTHWSQTRMQAVHRNTLPLTKVKAIQSWIKYLCWDTESFWL